MSVACYMSSHVVYVDVTSSVLQCTLVLSCHGLVYMLQRVVLCFLPPPYADNQSCLSPQFISNRPVLREGGVEITNTSIFLAWDINVPLPEGCSAVVFSIPSFAFMLDYRFSSTDIEPLFQTVGIMCS